MTRKNIGFLAASLFILISGFVLVHVLGFSEMASKYGTLPERLRDYTFPVWQQYNFSRHGFLAFLTKESFDAREAYSNHSPIYLVFLYILYKIELLFPNLPMRITSAYFSMAALVGVIIAILLPKNKVLLDYRGTTLVLIGLIYFLTMPTYWISAGKFNVDNPFHFIFPLLVLVSYKLSYGDSKQVGFWIIVFLLCILAPKIGILLGLFLMVRSFNGHSGQCGFSRPGIFMIVGGVLFSLLPVAVSKLLGFSSKNSGWLFRSGLDGDTTYFSNIVNAVVFPVDPRPVYLLLAPILVLGVQLISQYVRANTVAESDVSGSDKLFITILFAPYLLILTFWPQSVSIHPYLYDHFLVGPIAVWIVLNFASNRKEALYSRNFVFWFWAMAIMIMFNLTQIAQASRCVSCYYPSWN
jgi:hypothetical protein